MAINQRLGIYAGKKKHQLKCGSANFCLNPFTLVGYATISMLLCRAWATSGQRVSRSLATSPVPGSEIRVGLPFPDLELIIFASLSLTRHPGIIPAMWEPGTGYRLCFVSRSKIHVQRSKTCIDGFSWFQPVELMNGIKREHSLICKGPVEVLVLDREVKFQP